MVGDPANSLHTEKAQKIHMAEVLCPLLLVLAVLVSKKLKIAMTDWMLPC